MNVLDFFLNSPAMLAMTIPALLLVLAIPIGMYWERKHPKKTDVSPPAAVAARPFLGTRFEFLILVFVILVVTAIAIGIFRE